MAQVVTVTSGTSVVLISTLQSPNTVVLLSSVRYPGHIVGIRDTTFSTQIARYPIIVSTVAGVKLYDGTSSVLISQPGGQLSFSSWSPTTWQQLNTAGFFTTLSNAFLESLTSAYGSFLQMSTLQESISSVVAQRVTVTRDIEVLGLTQIQGNITLQGSLDIFSSLQSFDNLQLSSGLTVGGSVSFGSSLSVRGNLEVGTNLSTLQNLSVRDELVIDKSLYVDGALLPRNLSIQTLTVQRMEVGGGLLLAGGISSVRMSVGGNASVEGTGLLKGATNVQGTTAIADFLTVHGFLQTSSLQVNDTAAFYESSYANSLTASGGLSTLSSLQVSKRTLVEGLTTVEGPVNVTGSTVLSNVTIEGTSFLSSLLSLTSFEFSGNASAYGSSFQVTQELKVGSNLGIGGALLASQADFQISTGLSTLSNLAIGGNLSIQGLLSLRSNADVATQVSGLSSLTVNGNVNLVDLSVNGALFADTIVLSGIARASTVGAPISLTISSLFTSNTLVVDAVASTQSLVLAAYPDKILVNNPSNVDGYNLNVNGILQNVSTVTQLDFFNTGKLWTATTLRASTFAGLPNLSTAVIGTADFTNPLARQNGFVITGSNAAGNDIFTGLNQSTTFATTNGDFSFTGYKVRFNGTNQWVAVGFDVTCNNSILYSRTGYTWTSISSNGFLQGGRDVAYGAGRWVAVGYGSPMSPTDATIKYSLDGITWLNGSNTFPSAGGGADAIAYNGSNLWVAAGSNSSGVGLKYSPDGISWSNATIIGVSPGTGFQSVGFGNGTWLATTANQMVSSSNGNSWIFNPTGIPRRAFYYISNPGFWLGGGDAIFGNPNTTIQLSQDGSNWGTIQSGGFQNACYDVLHVPELSTFVAVGTDSMGASPTILKYAINPQFWLNNQQVYNGTGRGIAYGTIEVPQAGPFFTANVTSIFRSTLSSLTLTVSTIQASSFSGTYTGDGSLLTQVGEYSSSILASSITTRTVRTMDLSAGIVLARRLDASDTLSVNRNSFFSSGLLFLAAGSDTLTTGNIQTSVNQVDWRGALNDTFEFYGNDVAGNSNTTSPLFVAVGADSRTEYTIQWSVNGRVWNPITTGGFSNANSAGVREGTSVAYNATLGLWVAVGRDPGGSNTIQYSSDAINWSVASGGFTNFGIKVKVGNSVFVAYGNGVRYSLNGTGWATSFNQPAFTAIGYGLFTQGPFSLNVWLGAVGSNLYNSVNNGQSWTLFQNITLFAPLSDLTFATNVQSIFGSNLSGVWVGVGSNRIQTSFNGSNWSVVYQAPENVEFTSIAYNDSQNIFVAGARSPVGSNTLFRNVLVNGLVNWSAIGTGGFSTSTDTFGAGFGICSLGFSTFAVGKSALDINTAVRPSILTISTIGTQSNTVITSINLTASNASNLFSTTVRGIAAAPDEFFKLVAVGDGITPQKTIARSTDGSPGSWLPAVTGGFSTTGYGVTYTGNKWFAVGDAQASTNFIQYSPDGANWFGTNNAIGMSQGGRGIAVGISTLYSTLVVVGKGPTSTILHSQDGLSWSTSIGTHFNMQGNGVAAGLGYDLFTQIRDPLFLAVGQDSRGPLYSVLRSSNGVNWSTITNGGFNVAGYGAAYSPEITTWVIVGEDTDQTRTIQYSTDGSYFMFPSFNTFTKAGYAVTWNSSMSTFYAVGQDTNGDSPPTIKCSSNGMDWFNVSTNSGFISQKNVGSANGLFTQNIFTRETVPYLDMPNLIVYERETPFLFSKPTIRLQSSFMSFQETMFINLSSQLTVGASQPFQSSILTVYGDLYVSSLLYQGSVSIPSTMFVSSVIVSSLSTLGILCANSAEFPDFTLNQPSISRPNSLSTIGKSGFFQLAINQTLIVPNIDQTVQYPQPVGIGTFNPEMDLDVQGSLGASSFSTTYLYAPMNVNLSSIGDFFVDQYLTMTANSNTQAPAFRILATPSSLSFHSMTLQVSTQRVGIFTENPQYDLDMRRHGRLTGVQANELNTSLLFLTLQSV